MSNLVEDPYLIDSHKMHYHMERVLQASRDPLNTYPIYVEVSPVGHCNHRCSFCAVDYIGYKARNIDTVIWRDRVKEMGKLGVKSVMYAGEGEPLLHKDIAGWCEFTAEAGVDVAFTTNGVLLDKLWPVLDSVKWIKVSLNAGTEDIYKAVHKAKDGDWGRVWRGIEGAVARRGDTTIGVQMVVLPDNMGSIESLIRRAKSAGVNYVVLKPYSQHKSSITRTWEDIKYEEDAFSGARAMSEAGFKVIARTKAMEDKNKGGHSYEKCLSTPYFWAYIMATGDLYGCSAYLLNSEFCYGNINSEGFKEAWTGEKRRLSIERMKSLDISQCRVNCRMNQVNKWLWDVANPGEHANFI